MISQKIQTHIATCPDEMRCIAFLTLLVMRVSFFIYLFFSPSMLLKSTSISDISLWASRFLFVFFFRGVWEEVWIWVCVGGCVCFVCVVNRQRIDSNTREQHDDTTDVEEGSVTHLKATGLRESLFQLWFSIQSQKNISKIWKSGQVRLWSRNAGGDRFSFRFMD